MAAEGTSHSRKDDASLKADFISQIFLSTQGSGPRRIVG